MEVQGLKNGMLKITTNYREKVILTTTISKDEIQLGSSLF